MVWSLQASYFKLALTITATCWNDKHHWLMCHRYLQFMLINLVALNWDLHQVALGK